MQRTLLAVVLVLASCRSTLERAPGPEASDLAGAARGTLIVPPAGSGSLARTVVLIDLPSLRAREFRVEHDPIAIAGLDDAGLFVYAFDTEAGLSIGDLARYPFDLEEHRAPHFERWHLRGVDVASRVERDYGSLEGFPKQLELAPTGGNLIAVREPAAQAGDPGEQPSEVWCIDLAAGTRRLVTHQVGRVARCDWMPDGRAFALSGSAGGELFDTATLSSSGLRPHGFGPFTPDGRAYLERRGEGFALVELDGEALLLDDARMPWPATRGPAHERGDADPIGLCGARLALYEALPTQGQRVESSFARGGYFVFEHAAVKVADLESGTYATVWAGNESDWTPLFSPVRLASDAD